MRGPSIPLERSWHLAVGRREATDGDHEGDRGARDLIGADPRLVTNVDLGEAAPLDVDTPADYDELLRQSSRSTR